MIENNQIIKSMLLYILQKCSDDKRDVYSIVKTAFFAQQIHMAKYGCRLYDDRIVALKFGPVPSKIYDILKAIRGDGNTSNFSTFVNSFAVDNESFYGKEDPDLDYLSVADLNCINIAIEKVSKMNFNDIVKETHSKEWNRAFCSTSKIMDNICIAEEGNPENGAIEYLKESIELEFA